MSAEDKKTVEELNKLRAKTIHCVRDFVFVKGVELPIFYKDFENAIENFEVRNDDIWVCPFQKTGTTWTQEMVWCIKNDLDFEGAKVKLDDRFAFLDLCFLWDWSNRLDAETFKALQSITNSVEFIKNQPSPRLIKTHLPFQLLPRQIRTFQKKPKMIYVTRNSKDTCISNYHHFQLFRDYSGDFDDFCTLFLGGRMGYGCFWDHMKGYWEQRNHSNILFLKFEDMKADLPSAIRKTAEFLGKNFNKDQVQILANHLSFENMKSNPAVNMEELAQFTNNIYKREKKGTFIRKGETGQWKTVMPKKFIELFDKRDEEFRTKYGSDVYTEK